MYEPLATKPCFDRFVAEKTHDFGDAIECPECQGSGRDITGGCRRCDGVGVEPCAACGSAESVFETRFGEPEVHHGEVFCGACLEKGEHK